MVLLRLLARSAARWRGSRTRTRCDALLYGTGARIGRVCRVRWLFRHREEHEYQDRDEVHPVFLDERLFDRLLLRRCVLSIRRLLRHAPCASRSACQQSPSRITHCDGTSGISSRSSVSNVRARDADRAPTSGHACASSGPLTSTEYDSAMTDDVGFSGSSERCNLMTSRSGSSSGVLRKHWGSVDEFHCSTNALRIGNRLWRCQSRVPGSLRESTRVAVDEHELVP